MVDNHEHRAPQEAGQPRSASASRAGCAGARYGILDSLRCLDGGWSCQRIVTMLVCLAVLGMWMWGCFWEGKYIHLGWEEVTLLVGSQTAKAGQLYFERGLHGPADGPEGEG